MSTDYDELHDWGTTSENGFGWEDKVFERIKLVYPDAFRMIGENEDGDIDLGNGTLLEVKWESNSAESKRVCVEIGRVYHNNQQNFYDVERRQSGLMATKSKFYIFCNTDNKIIITPVNYLKYAIEEYRETLLWQYDVRLRQTHGTYNYHDNVLVYYNQFKDFEGLLGFSMSCQYEEFNENFIKLWIQ